jgi:hypothetical protein
MIRKTRAQREAEILEKLKRPRRILRGRPVVQFTARVEQDAFDYFEELRKSRCQAKSKALTEILREHEIWVGLS